MRYAALEPLSSQVLRDRVKVLFSAAYLALTGVIQGGVLSQLWTSLRPPGDLAEVLPQAIVTGTAILVIYHEYLDFTLVLRWIPGILDILIPFLLGGAEFWVDLSIGQRASWWIALAVLYAIGGGAFWHTLFRAHDDIFRGNPVGYRRYRAIVRWQMAVCAAGAAVSALVAVMAASGALPPAGALSFEAVVFAGGVVIAALREYDQYKIYGEYGVWGTWRVAPAAPSPSRQRQRTGRRSLAAPGR
jgi:hypothetical protein